MPTVDNRFYTEIAEHFAAPGEPPAPTRQVSPSPNSHFDRLHFIAEKLELLLVASDLPSIRKLARDALAAARMEDARTLSSAGVTPGTCGACGGSGRIEITNQNGDVLIDYQCALCVGQGELK